MVQDGVFIYVPDGVEARKTLQIIKMIDLEENLFVQNRNLIILGRNSSLNLMHCDDSINQHSSLVNTVTEVFVSEGARLELYKLQNLNDQSGLVNSTFIRQMADSTVKSNTLTFNCGLIRNSVHISLDGKGAHADVLGLYLMDKSQHVDNQIRIDHNQPNCTSNELFKGILDDQASAVFNGYIHVARDAQKTNAYQNNNNILLKPFTVHVHDELSARGLVCFSGLDGYRTVFSYSELFNRADGIKAIFAVTEEEGGMFRLFHPADFFADRSVKSLQEVYIFQP
jgi:Fe-S cluster assembly protein SufD